MKRTLALIALGAVALTACGGGTKQDYIDASVEMVCGISMNDMQGFDENKMEERAKSIFAKHGFNVDNEAEMAALVDSFDEDPNVEKEITEKTTACMAEKFKDMGGFAGMEDAFSDMK